MNRGRTEQQYGMTLVTQQYGMSRGAGREGIAVRGLWSSLGKKMYGFFLPLCLEVDQISASWPGDLCTTHTVISVRSDSACRPSIIEKKLYSSQPLWSEESHYENPRTIFASKNSYVVHGFKITRPSKKCPPQKFAPLSRDRLDVGGLHDFAESLERSCYLGIAEPVFVLNGVASCLFGIFGIFFMMSTLQSMFPDEEDEVQPDAPTEDDESTEKDEDAKDSTTAVAPAPASRATSVDAYRALQEDTAPFEERLETKLVNASYEVDYLVSARMIDVIGEAAGGSNPISATKGVEIVKVNYETEFQDAHFEAGDVVTVKATLQHSGFRTIVITLLCAFLLKIICNHWEAGEGWSWLWEGGGLIFTSAGTPFLRCIRTYLGRRGTIADVASCCVSWTTTNCLEERIGTYISHGGGGRGRWRPSSD